MVADISALIVTWNRKEDVLECIDSLLSLSYPLLTIYVVDNASFDGTSEAITKRYPAVRLIRSETNQGFAEGNNRGLQRILDTASEGVLLVNDDVVLAPDALDRLIEAGWADPKMGVMCPKVVLHGQPEVIWSKGGVIDPETGIARQLGFSEVDDRNESPFEVDYAVGCAMLVKTRAINRVGLLDPRYFMYYEEADWCRRMRMIGYKIKYVPSSRAMHKVSLGSISRNSASYYFSRNRLLYLQCAGAKRNGIAKAAAGLIRSGAVHIMRGRYRTGRLMLSGVFDFYRRRFGKYEGAS